MDATIEERLRTGLRASAEAVTVPADLPARVERRITAQRRQVRGVRVAAGVLVVAALTGIAARGHGTTESGSPTSTDGEPAVIWPLNETVPSDRLATPRSAARAYLAEVIGTGRNIRLGGAALQGPDATVRYTLEGTRAAVTLTRRGGSWLVTDATNELVVIDEVTEPSDGHVDVEVTRGRLDAPVQRLRARLVDTTGHVYDTADVEFENGQRVEGTDQPLADGSWHTYLSVGETTEPVAVRVDVLSSDSDDDSVVAHASVAVPGAAAAAQAAPDSTDTAVPRATVDPDPEPMPPAIDRIPALRTDIDPAGTGPGSAQSLDQWQDAATALLLTVIDDDGPAGPPTFSGVSIDRDSPVLRGRYSMPDGDSGVFELVRVQDGSWGMTSLRSDALEIVNVGRTGSRVQVTLTSTKDADLGVGGFQVGPAPTEPWVSAGRAAVFSVPCRDGSAVLFQFLEAHDGTNMRVAEAWPCQP